MAELESREGPCVSCTTLNILAPIYKRLDQQVCLFLLNLFAKPKSKVVICSQQRLWSYTCSEQREANVCGKIGGSEEGNEEEEAVGLKVKHAVLFPREVEKGMWPDGYSLSDHARLQWCFHQ